MLTATRTPGAAAWSPATGVLRLGEEVVATSGRVVLTPDAVPVIAYVTASGDQGRTLAPDGAQWRDTGVTGENGNYGGPCPPAGEKAHRYVFTVYALAVADIDAAAGVPKTGTAALHGFVLNRGLGRKMLGKASFTALYGR